MEAINKGGGFDKAQPPVSLNMAASVVFMAKNLILTDCDFRVSWAWLMLHFWSWALMHISAAQFIKLTVLFLGPTKFILELYL